MNLVTITGMKRHGKDTLAGYLIDYFASVGLAFERASLADPIKDQVAAELGVTRDELETLKRTDPAVRQRLQTVGQARRETDPDYWIDTLLSRLDNDRNYIITDARYENELDALGWFGPRVLIYRPGIDDGDVHPSEAYARSLAAMADSMRPGYFSEPRPFDYAVENSDTLHTLRECSRELGRGLCNFLDGFHRGQNSVTWTALPSAPDAPPVSLPSWVRREMEKNSAAQAAAVPGV